MIFSIPSIDKESVHYKFSISDLFAERNTSVDPASASITPSHVMAGIARGDSMPGMAGQR